MWRSGHTFITLVLLLNLSLLGFSSGFRVDSDDEAGLSEIERILQATQNQNSRVKRSDRGVT
jgi:hypothetical protein